MADPTTVLRYARNVARRDVPNLVRHGRNGPRWAERIWFDPRAVRAVVFGYRDEASGAVASGWELSATPLHELPKVQAAIRHWGEGIAWERTGIFDHLLREIAERGAADGCRSREELVARYRSIDAMFDAVRTERRIRTRRELAGLRAFRELGGIRIHVGPDRSPVFGGAGQHRLAMAQVLGLPIAPAQVGLVHPDALSSWRRDYRRP